MKSRRRILAEMLWSILQVIIKDTWKYFVVSPYKRHIVIKTILRITKHLL